MLPIKDGKDRCKNCNHLQSFHFQQGCTMWLFGVRAFPLYRCACACNNIDVVKDDYFKVHSPIATKQPSIHIKSITALDFPTLCKELQKTMSELQEASDELNRAYKALTEKRLQEGK